MAENILIEFTASTEGLEPAVDQLERIGAIDKQAAAAFKATNAELQKKQQIINSVGRSAQDSWQKTKKSIDDLDKATQQFIADFIEGFQNGIMDELNKAGVSLQEFLDALKNGNNGAAKSTESLKSQLSDVTRQLQLLKKEGKDNTDQYEELRKEAGSLRDAIADVNTEINNAASNSENLQGLVETAQGITAGFAVAQGAVGLFGEQGEELQETLLKVNSAMAILQGLQQVQTVLQKESAAATFLQTVGQKIYNVVIGESIGLMAAFRVALAATGVGLLILGIAALVNVLEQQEKQLEKVNAALDANKNAIEADTQAIEDLAEAEIARAEAAGALESDLIKIRGNSLLQQRRAIEEARDRAIAERDALDTTSEGWFKLNAAVEENNARIKEIDSKTQIEGINLARQQREEQLKAVADTAAARLAATVKNSKAELDAAKASARAKAAVDINAVGQNATEVLRIQAELNDQIRDLDRQFAQVRLQDRIAGIEAALLTEQQLSRAISERQSQTEIDLQKRLIQQKANLELLQEGLTQNQILEIKKRAQTEIATLQKNFNKQISEEALQDFISSNNAQLAAIDLTNKERLDLTIDNIIAQAEIEVQQNQGLSEKIKEINAKRDADIRAARLESIRQTVEEEIALRTATGGVDTRADEKLLAAQDQLRAASSEREKRAIEERLAVRRLSLNEELNLIDQLADRELSNIGLRVDALDESFAEGLISYKDYNIQYEQLTDQQAQVTEDAEQRKRDAIAKTAETQRAANQRAIQQTAEYAQQIGDILNGFAENQQQRELNKLDADRQRIEELRKEGKISEQEATARLKRLDVAERRIRREQAQREKQLAIFNAIIATAVAVARAGNPILAAIAAALGAAQIAVIASKPIPQFAKGKKNSYQGPGIVGEAGSELIEKNGQLFIAPKKTIVWLGSKDKVYNHQETVRMLEKPGLKTERIDRLDSHDKIGHQSLDYDKLGAAIAKGSSSISLNIDGYKDFVINGHNFTTYLNSRRGYK